MDGSSESSPRLDDSAAIKLTGKIMMVTMLVLFVLVAFVLFIHLYAKWFWYRREQDTAINDPPTRRRRRRFDFGPGYQESASAAVIHRGLDPSVLNSIPVIVFHSEEFKLGLECSVCLSDISDGEKARLLPKCNHGFHVDCIDMWFRSHSTCPLCRNPISSSNSTSDELSPDTVLQSSPESNSSANGYSTDSFNFPTNVLYWGSQTQISTMDSNLDENGQSPTCYQPHCSSSSPSSTSDNRAEGMLAIDIPRDMDEEEEVKSPVMTRLRRLLSREKKIVACTSPSNLDVEEQAGRGQS